MRTIKSHLKPAARKQAEHFQSVSDMQKWGGGLDALKSFYSIPNYCHEIFARERICVNDNNVLLSVRHKKKFSYLCSVWPLNPLLVTSDFSLPNTEVLLRSAAPSPDVPVIPPNRRLISSAYWSIMPLGQQWPSDSWHPSVRPSVPGEALHALSSSDWAVNFSSSSSVPLNIN